MYAVLFDLDTNCLNDNYEGTSYHNNDLAPAVRMILN